jgi:uncharacterized protein YcgI (DUF1989 family)
MTRITVPPREGRAVRMSHGQRITIATPKGRQAADFFAFNALNVGEWLSPNHTWITTFHTKPREGDLLLSRFRRPMLRFLRDGAAGVHDMMIPACDQFRYEFFGHRGPHASCSENLCVAMRREGYQIDVIPQPVNFFTNTRVEPDSRFVSPPNPVPPGAEVELEALMDLICVVSSCPFDLDVDGWEINAGAEITELTVEVTDGQAVAKSS